ncbi:AtuA-related protein [Rhodococcus ruber]|uniref:AtuA-related protein n=1 Tax=Rhodococcus ruber TaxID=1830 RepID=UPI000E6B2CDB|nr:hypothetical protein [Rhodococcus ruber]AXY49291.1 beta-lactamase [Rhodococcus ruber]
MTRINTNVDYRLPLHRIAQARSGGKNDICDVTVFLPTAELFELVEPMLTTERVRRRMAPLATGRIDRYVLPTVWGVKFVLHDALDGGGARSLRNDSYGKSMAAALLTMTVSGVPLDLAQASPTYYGPDTGR